MDDLKPYEVMILTKHLKCQRCGHAWIQKGKELPRTCPRCHSPYWMTARRPRTDAQKT